MMCQGTARKPISKQSVESWYMNHVFKDLRGSWRCISFAKTKRRKYNSQAEMARSLNLQRASARAAAVAARTHSGSEKGRWMVKTFGALYSNTQQKKSKQGKDHTFSKLKKLIYSTFDSRETERRSTSSLTDLIPQFDFDYDDFGISTDSDLQARGAPPSRRSSSSSFGASMSTRTPDTTTAAGGSFSESQRSRFRAARCYRRKRSSFREAKPSQTGIGRRRSVSNARSVPATTPDYLSRGTTMTMDTSTSPCKSSPTSWLENRDLLTESLSSESSSGKLAFVDDTQETGEEIWNQDVGASEKDWYRKKPSSLNSTSTHRPPAPAVSISSEVHLEHFDILMTRSLSSGSWNGKICSVDDSNGGGGESRRATVFATKSDRYRKKPSSDCHSNSTQRPLTPPASISSDPNLQQRQASAIGKLHTAQQDFQEAIVDIILENDVHDLVDLEEFLQGYFRLNSLYQDIIQQFFNDLSNDLVDPQVSKAPAIFARLASASEKSVASARGNPLVNSEKTDNIAPSL